MTQSAHHDNAHAHGDHGHDGHDHEEHDDYHGTVKGYTVGFLLSVLLTAIPFWLVMAKVLPSSGVTAAVILGFAVVQIVVHMVYFLHMNTKSEGGWNMLALIFTIVIVVITLAGSLWVMHHLNVNMMPMPHEMRNMP
ncbi:cytochrome o ubiquinol oxidase subunit IV [Lysobacter enzymogenes]|uniref:cytochrome o ubiquinol oxidase subunit IV n=1 Tax=Lysobacter enzymogenes TaxID=69 RepID=UPI001A96027B|nr:cytochrome o ubiquinol oxidase subunit IV [Lysobacter enzymogenes]QQP97084.1 cytochrome o ubiquinol oxidase subunit IV [Lysobacter enzymogenes]